jgi:hypothetical protein
VAAGTVFKITGVEVAGLPAWSPAVGAAGLTAGVAAGVVVAGPGEPAAFSEGPAEGKVRVIEVESSPQADKSKLPITSRISSRPGNRNNL